jgi:predicted RNA-binding Zn-ribbon protein involved in translation (DUF1610 family)
MRRRESEESSRLKQCPSCGERLWIQDRYCPDCGVLVAPPRHRIRDDSEPPPNGDGDNDATNPPGTDPPG